MNDDGTKRNGYAEYIALTLHDHGFTTNDVAVIYVKDAKTPMKSIEQGEGRVLGKARMVK